MSIVSLAVAKAHLEVIGNGQDAKIQGYLNAAERHAEQFMGRPLQPWDDSSEPVVPDDVVQGILLILGDFYSLREASVVGISYTTNPAAASLLHFHRQGLGV